MSASTAEMETVFSKQFKAFIEAEGPSPMRELRTRAFEVFNKLGFPHPKLEDWKYTNVASIAKVEWTVIGEDTSKVSEAEVAELAGFNLGRNGFTALNMAFADVAFVRVPKDEVVDVPIEFDFTGENGAAIFPHIVVIAEPGSKATIIEKYGSLAESFTN